MASSAAGASDVAPSATEIPLSQTPKFAPWIRQLENQLYDAAHEAVEVTTGQRVDSDAEEMGEEEMQERAEAEKRKQLSMGAAAYEAQRLESIRRAGGKVQKLGQFIAQDLLPQMPSDPEALFLAASVDFVACNWASALSLMRTSLMATHEARYPRRVLAARHYFVALIAIRVVTGASAPQQEGSSKIDTGAKLTPERLSELCGVIERGLRECLRFDPRHHSAYIDAEMLANIRHPEDAHARVALHAELVAEACETGKYWVDKMQRPMHFYPKLRSAAWWDPFEFPWALKLMQNFAEIKAEMLGMRQPPTSERRAETWDHVGNTHDAGDRELVENGSWTELVLLNRDEKVASLVARNRRLCPNTLRILDSIPEASDMARRGSGESTFSALAPVAHLKPHCGGTNCRLTCHLPLVAPKGCKIRVGHETRAYREGEMMIFDDSFEHEVWMNGPPNSIRVVLLIRFWHPDIPPSRWPEAQHHMAKLYHRHRRRLNVPPLCKHPPEKSAPQV